MKVRKDVIENIKGNQKKLVELQAQLAKTEQANIIKLSSPDSGDHPVAVSVQCLALALITTQEMGGIKMLLYRYLIHWL